MKHFSIVVLASVIISTGCVQSFSSLSFPDDGGAEGGAGGGSDIDAGTDSSVKDGASSSSASTSSSGGCVKKTCVSYGFNCGNADDGCGHILDCGLCSALQSCGGAGVNGVCGVTPCQAALNNVTNVSLLAGSDLSVYYGVLNCVCHTVNTTNQCGFDSASQLLCGTGGDNTGNITQNFLSNDMIGPCCAQQCVTELKLCRGQ